MKIKLPRHKKASLITKHSDMFSYPPIPPTAKWTLTETDDFVITRKELEVVINALKVAKEALDILVEK